MIIRASLTLGESGIWFQALQGIAQRKGLTPNQIATSQVEGGKVRWLVRATIEDVPALLEALTRIDEGQIRQAWAMGKPLPALSSSIQAGRVVYERHDPKEEWLTYVQIIDRGRADCEDLAAAAAAELRTGGVEARADTYATGPYTHHAVTFTQGTVIDPSRMAGMGAY